MSNESLKAFLTALLTLSNENLAKVKEFMETLIKPTPVLAPILPTEMTIGDRTYQILGLLKGDEKHISGKMMVDRAKEKNAILGLEDYYYILEHQNEIPSVCRGRVFFVFPGLCLKSSSDLVAYVYWHSVSWIQFWCWLGDDWRGNARVLRRKPAAAGK